MSEHVEIARQGAVAIRKWRKAKPDRQLNLKGADLCGANLCGADLAGADLTFANLSDARLRNAKLENAKLTLTRLLNVDFSGSDLNYADLGGSDLSGATLADATLFGTRFADCEVTNTDFASSNMARALFADMDLSTARGLAEVNHLDASEICISTIYKSHGRISEVFLRSCGVPETLITYLPSLGGKAFDFFKCFISFTEADDIFSMRLYNDLQGAGIRCWRWKEDARWGRTLMREVDQAIRFYDKLVVILSDNSLQAEPVIREIERALQKEQRDAKEVLFPIRVDDAVFSWEHELQSDVVRKTVGDFRNWTDPEQYQKSLDRLIHNLRPGPDEAAAD